MSDLQVFLFGSPRIEYQGKVAEVERRKALALVAYLALAKRSYTRDTLAGLLWPDLDHERARAALRSTLPALTSFSPPDWLDIDRMSLKLKRDVIEVDVLTFLDLLAQSRLHGHSLDAVCGACIPLLEQMVSLYSDDFLADFALPDNAEYEQWQMTQREWLRREFSGVLRRLATYYADNSANDEAILYANQWLERDPLHEPAHRMLIRLYAASGQRTHALRQYQSCVDLLNAELATPPEDETTQLYEWVKANSSAGESLKIAQTAAPSSVLPSLPSLIVGRDEAFREIKSRLGIGGELRPITVIQGWPGVGKSTMVAALAHQPDLIQTFPDGVLWASLGETPGLVTTLLSWADALKVSDPGKMPALEEITAQLTAVLREKRVLLILDDVWQADHATPFKVGGRHCALIITSRLNEVAAALAPTPRDVYRLPVLSDDNALELLGTLAPDTVASHHDEARELVRDLEGLPLAIQVAGRLLHNEARLGWGIADLLAELREGASLLSAQIPGDIGGVGRDTTPTIAALLKRSTDLLDEETRQRFAFLGLFASKPATFDLDAIATAWDIGDARPAVRILVNRGLLEPVSGGRFQIHALLVMHARALLEME